MQLPYGSIPDAWCVRLEKLIWQTLATCPKPAAKKLCFATVLGLLCVYKIRYSRNRRSSSSCLRVPTLHSPRTLPALNAHFSERIDLGKQLEFCVITTTTVHVDVHCSSFQSSARVKVLWLGLAWRPGPCYSVTCKRGVSTEGPARPRVFASKSSDRGLASTFFREGSALVCVVALSFTP